MRIAIGNARVIGHSVGGIGLALVLAACGGSAEEAPPIGTTQQSLEHRAYIVSLKSEELTVIDLDRLEIIARVPTGGVDNHMGELNRDFTKIYVDSSHNDESIVVDTRTLQVTNRIETGSHPSHLTLMPDGNRFAIMNEYGNDISFVDTTTESEVKRLPGFFTPHFMRYSHDGRYGYVANIGAHHVTRVDLGSLEIVDHVVLDGFEGPPVPTMAPDEEGFADVQIDRTGILYAAHARTGRVLVYDTARGMKLPELSVGNRPWIVFAEQPFAEVPLKHLVPNFGDRTVSLIDGLHVPSVVTALSGDEEAYGVNFSSRAPNTAFVMNRIREDVAVVDTEKGEIVERIAVGGNTETASTTADGKWIVAAVSSANRVVVIDAVTRQIVKTFDGVGNYPWSVTIPRGQNYCH